MPVKPSRSKTVGTSLVLRARTLPVYALSEMLAECDFSLPMTEEEQDWMATPAVGRELL